MTAFSDLEAVSPIFRLNRWEHPVGEHHWHAWFFCPGCKDHHAIGDTWTFNGNWHKPTFSPSFLTWNDPDPRAQPGKFRDGWRCHSFIRDGQIEFLPDCTHKLAGQTVPIPNWDDEKQCDD